MLRLRPSRRKARDLAIAEVMAMLRGLAAHPAAGGPFASTGEIAWVNVAEHDLERAIARLSGLGYSGAIELVAPVNQESRRVRSPVTRWKGREVTTIPVWAETDEALRGNAPDRRRFLLECADGVTRPIVGYRGGVGPLEHRALPVEDARLLVNLAVPETGGRILDPFAGAGAVIVAARARGLITASADIDRALRFGLSELSNHHVVADARALPFAAGAFDAIASEPPYHPGARDAVSASIVEAARVVRKGGRIALLVAAAQAPPIRDAGPRAGLVLEIDSAIDRKGTAVSCLCWIRP